MLKHNDLSIPAYYKWGSYSELLRQIKFPGNYQIDLIGHLAPQWELIEKAEQKLKLPLKRWKKLLECEVVQDFCLPYWRMIGSGVLFLVTCRPGDR